MATFDLPDYEYPEVDDQSTATPSTTADSPLPEAGPLKKKRKAWGQPIPEFKVVLPPRKRAKTVEEKEQRKNERVIRNRKAADKSRQRQKAAVAELEVKTSHMAAELAQLRQKVAYFESKYGTVQDLEIPSFPTSLSPTSQQLPAKHTPAPTKLRPSILADVPDKLSAGQFSSTTMSQLSPGDSSSRNTTPGPTLCLDSPRPSMSSDHSPPLAPTLFAKPGAFSISDHGYANLPPNDLNFDEVFTAAQYSAAVLCDSQQCPVQAPKKLTSQEEAKQFNIRLLLVNLTILITIYETFSTSMLLPIAQIFWSLTETLSTTFLSQEWMDQHFPLIHSLITMPTLKTTRPVFRMKLLSRLLACSPSLARLLEAATDRPLQRLIDEEAYLNGSEGRQQWASLLTLKHVIRVLEKEHKRYRLVIDGPRNKDQALPEVARGVGLIKKQMDGVDYRAVEKSLWRWRSDDVLPAGPDVH